MQQPLKGKVALVTGATRGIGRGIALQLGEAGAVVYITGRTMTSKTGSGSLEETANEIKKRGGVCIPVQVDHENDVQIRDLFKKIETEQEGKLDILVNNAYKAVETIFGSRGQSFFEIEPEVWDNVNNVGLRNHYICTVYAARLMAPRKQGLIINITSHGALKYIFNVAYGVGKAALNRMSADCGIELKPHNVTVLSLCPGPVKTELVTKYLANDPTGQTEKIFGNAESTEFSGKVVVSLAQEPDLIKHTSSVIETAVYANEHDIKDIDGQYVKPTNMQKS